MATLLKSNAVFLHIPKTGGSWVVKVLQELDAIQATLGREHATFDQHFWYDRFHRDPKVARNLARRAVGWIPKVQPNCYKFCFIREPITWYVSWWRFMQSRDWRQWGDEKNPYQWHPTMMLNGLGSPDFNVFMHNVNRKRPGFVTELFGWYVRPGVNFVGKQENLVSDMAKVLKDLNYPNCEEKLRTLPRVNQVKGTIPRPEWDPEIRRETMALEYAGYVRYGYPVEREALEFSSADR